MTLGTSFAHQRASTFNERGKEPMKPTCVSLATSMFSTTGDGRNESPGCMAGEPESGKHPSVSDRRIEAVDSRQVGILVGGVVWCGLLFKPVMAWLVAMASANGVWLDVVFGLGGIAGFLICAFIGAGIAQTIAGGRRP